MYYYNHEGSIIGLKKEIRERDNLLVKLYNKEPLTPEEKLLFKVIGERENG